METTRPVLSVEDLWVEYHSARGTVKAVRGVSFSLHPGETLALIGESGSGKTTLGLALMRLTPREGRIRSGKITYQRGDHALDVLTLSREELRRFRWQECAMVFQSALNSLNPILRVWDHLYDTAKAHGQTSRKEVHARSVELLRLVQLEPHRVLYAYPHELSGGMRQRVLLALALLLKPQLLILDEPTTALDILTQRAIIDLLRRLSKQLGFSMIFISHDLAIAAELADRVATLYAGRIVELGEVRDMFYRPKHPYTHGLISAIPTVSGQYLQLTSIPGSPPDLITPPAGCKFHPRCPYADSRCSEQEPELEPVTRDHLAACFYPGRVPTLTKAVGE